MVRRRDIDLSFTPHAESMLKERSISLEWVMRAIAEPERIERKDDGTAHYLKPVVEREGRILRVITASGSEPVRVITTFFDRRERRRQ